MKKLEVVDFDLKALGENEDADYIGHLLCNTIEKLNADADTIYLIKLYINSTMSRENVQSLTRTLNQWMHEMGAADNYLFVPCGAWGLEDVKIDKIVVTEDDRKDEDFEPNIIDLRQTTAD